MSNQRWPSHFTCTLKHRRFNKDAAKDAYGEGHTRARNTRRSAGEQKKRDRARDRKRRRHDREESETEEIREGTMRQGDRDRVAEDGGGGSRSAAVGEEGEQAASLLSEVYRRSI